MEPNKVGDKNPSITRIYSNGRLEALLLLSANDITKYDC